MTDPDHTGVVRTWHDEEGWGVIDSAATPGGCWAHWSTVLIDGYRRLEPGSQVAFEWESAAQDGYDHRALKVRPAGRPVPGGASPHHESTTTGSAMGSTLVLTFDEPLDPETAQALSVDGALPAAAVTARTGTAADLGEVQRLWAATFPHLPAPDFRQALSTGRTLVLAAPSEPTSNGPLAGAAVFTAVDDVPGERRLTVLADRPDRWLAVEGAAAGELRRQGVGRWHVVVREDAQESVQQLAAAGYVLASRSWGAVLLAEAVDTAQLHLLVDAAVSAGYVLRQLTAEDAEAAHRLVADCRGDFPVTPATPAPDPTREQVLISMSGEGHLAYGAFAGTGPGARLVGITTLEVVLDDGAADTDYTAVAADVRGRGVATAVKACAVLDLLRQGVRTFRTGGAAMNEASLGANRRLGYQVEPIWGTWSRH